jgi:glutathione S-transferase
VTAKLYALPASHPCEAIEVAMRLKGVPCERVDMIPVLSKAMQWQRFRAFTVPGVVFDDGKKVLGSREIVRELEHRAPEPPLLPHDARERRLVEDAERWGDEVLQPLGRRLAWATLKRTPGSMMSYSANSDLPVPDALARLSAPLLAHASSRFNHAGDAEVRADLVNLEFHLERADTWLEKGAIGGEQPNAADLQIGSGLRLLLTIGDLEPVVGAHPSAEVARRWFADYPGHAPAGTLPREWLAARAPA